MSEGESKTIKRAEQHLDELQETSADVAGATDPDVLAISQFPDLLSGFTVPIRMPTRDKLSVRLVPLEWLNRFEEYKDGEAEFLAILSALFGGLLGVIVNVATGGFQTTPYFWAFVGLLCLMGLLFIRLLVQMRSRAKKLKDQMLRSFGIEERSETGTSVEQTD